MKPINETKKSFLTVLFISAVSTLLMTQIYADDTEVFITSSTALNPNVLFIMDNSASMDGPDNPKGSPLINGKTRLQIMKDTLNSVLSSADNNLNVGITNYGSTDTWRNDNANGIKFPITPLNTLIQPIIEESLKDKAGVVQWRQHRQPAPEGNGISASFNPIVKNFNDLTVRDYIPEVANAWVAYGNTPIVDALYEAALYFRGGEIKYQHVSGYGGRGHYKAAAHPSTYRYPEGVFFESDAFPGHEFPYIPQWYADNLSDVWSSRSADENGYYLSYLKTATRDWSPTWIRCPANTGDVNNNGRDDGNNEYNPNPLRNSGPSTNQNCRIMRNDFVKYLQSEFGNVFNAAVNGINSNESAGTVDQRVRRAIRKLEDDDLEAKASRTVIKADVYSSGVVDDRKVYHFDAFPRCRVVQDVVCMTEEVEFDWGISWAQKRAKYQCATENSESCRSWNFERCVNPADERRVNEVVCDFDQNLSRYPAAKYTSPIMGDCQSNFIVLMSDGKPEYSTGDRVSLRAKNHSNLTYYRSIQQMTGVECADDPYYKAGTCGPELTKFLATNDQMPGNDAASAGDQFVNTMVIGFSNTVSSDTDATNYLESLVTIEDKTETPHRDGFFIANNEAELVQAFTDALTEIVVSARSQASPGYSVNVKSGLEHEDNVFIPVFEKTNSDTWRGNLKKFKLVNVGGHRQIRGKTPGINAMTELGIFKDEAWDLWSTSSTADGKSVKKGGVASLIDDPLHRKVFSNITGDSNVNLWSDDNLLRPENDLIQNSWVSQGASEPVNEAYRKKLVRYARGWEQGEEAQGARKYMGDMLHSEPVIITYDKGDADGNGKKQYIFAATNEGYLHAFDTTTGEEKFAFMPRQLLKNLYRQFVGNEDEHTYGIDGDLSFVKDGSHVYLYFGLRRGGKAYYALDISDITKPKLMWKIDGETDAGFSHLGQSWSTPYIANVKVGATKKTVIVFTGGYDTTFDYGEGASYDSTSVTDNRKATVGDDIYIVNAKTGARLWSMRETMLRTDVEHAIPGGVHILDTDNNGLLDRLYFADTGGNVWRLDLHENLSEPEKSKLVKIAELGGSGTNRRKFFTEPDVARLTENGQEIFTIALGSGLRSHPLNEEITDYMFVLLEKSPLKPLEETGSGKYKTIKINRLANVKVTAVASTANNTISKTLTHTGFKSGADDVKSILHAKDSNGESMRGWYVKFSEADEKVLSPAITFEGSLIFTSFVPKAIVAGEGISACASPGTQGRIYAMNILTGEASIDLNRKNSVNDNDTFAVISANEIPGKPQRIFNKLDCSGGSCKHVVDVRIGKKGSEAGAQDVSKVESIYWNNPD